MECCSEHSGLVERLKSITDKLETIDKKLDEVVKNQTDTNTALVTEKIENKWRHKAIACIWGILGGIVGSGGTILASLVLEKYITR